MAASVDHAIAPLARAQHGAWSRRQALDAGACPSLIDRRLRTGTWLKLDAAVYASPAAPATWHRSIMAAVLAEPWALASHRSAAVLHQLAGFRPGRPEISIRPGANARSGLAIAHRAVDTRGTTVDRIPCVTLDQVFVDLAPHTSERRLGEALARRVDATPRLLDAVRDRYCLLAPRGGRNLQRLRSVLDQFGVGDGPDETELERHMRLLFTRPDVPPIRWQADFPGRLAGPKRVDGLIEAWRIVLEGDGRTWHARVDDFDRDRRRDQAAAAAGYLTLRYSYHQVVNEPEWCLATLLAAGAQRPAA